MGEASAADGDLPAAALEPTPFGGGIADGAAAGGRTETANLEKNSGGVKKSVCMGALDGNALGI
jgi:hypothetical protein